MKLVPSALRALAQPEHILNILDRVAKIGDRVRVTSLAGSDTHFIFHPRDIGNIFRRNHKRIEIAQKQIDMLKGKDTSHQPIITNTSGKPWQKERKIMAKHIHPVRGLNDDSMNVVSDEIGRLIKSWKGKNSIPLAQESSDLFIRLAYRVMFNQEASPETCRKLEHAAKRINRHQFTVGLSSSGVLKKISENLPGLKHAMTAFHEEVSKIRQNYLMQKQCSPPSTPILLDDLYDADNPDLSEARITMIIRGSHTTSTYTLFNAIWNLSTRPDYQERIAAGNVEDPILNQVIKETLRLNPPVYLIPRDIKDDIILDDGYKIQSGSSVIISPYITGKDSRFVPNPHFFDPEKNDNIEKDSSIYYGVGPRKCPGREMAEQQVRTAIQQICSRFEFSRATKDKPRSTATVMMLPDQSCQIALKPR